MCHGHPRYHTCAHTSMAWYYCPSASIDLQTGYETPCRKVTLAPAQVAKNPCPLSTCYFKEKGGQWICCQCKQGPNRQGWCTMPLMPQRGDVAFPGQLQMTCDHGCCKRCKKTDVDAQQHEQEAEWLPDPQYQGPASPSSSDCSRRSWRLSDGSLSASPTSSKASSVYGSHDDCSRSGKKKSSRTRK